MKLLVTGGAGFIGSNFIRYYLEAHPQDQIVNLDKLTYAGHLSSTKDFENNPNYKFIKGDIVAINDVEEAMDGVDIVVHLPQNPMLTVRFWTRWNLSKLMS